MAGSSRRRRLVAVTVAVLLATPAGVAGVAAQEEPGDADAVAFARTVEEMKGHLTVSVRLLEAGERERAATHAAHPVGEYWSVVGPELRAANETLAADLKATLEALPERASNASAAEYRDLIEGEVFALLDRAERAVVGDRASDATFQAKVVRELLQRTTQEYREGVDGNGTVTEPVEYRDAVGFRLRAAATYREHVNATLEAHAAREVLALFESLADATADSEPPADVTRFAENIASELAEYTGIESEVEGGEVAATVAEIEEHLHEAVAAYEAGNTSRAKQIVRQTYLSYFEGLEGDLISERPELVEELEVAFNEELPGLMENNASASEVREKVESMEEKLHTVEEVLAGNGTTTTIDLSDDTTTTESTTTTTTTDGDSTAGGIPGFGAGVALVATLLGALLVARRAR